ncbi:MAG: RIP metalloprotease RseP [Hylemonella sp.]|uniref:RIP metalloprotease RseP n=1 Tax=Hylemonella sp. TaxID=2066020 RepID=UPI0022C117AC|nr:RIP metalloprotease RseP [Hylemonella sp.]MCZ8251588.1 RIP metalloprotease RseP [Hylemonella sp.]
MLTVVAFIVALSLLIAIHEYGHYRMAVACGVKVLRFSIGFGHTLLRWQPKGSPTEFVLAAFPLGGYVRMLDEREGPVDPAERHLAFNTQPLRSRALIVAAGPLANLLLAVLLYAAVNWGGVQMAAPLLGPPAAESVAERAGFTGGERVLRAGFEGQEPQEMVAFEDLRWLLTRGALEGRDVRLVLAGPGGRGETERLLPLAAMDARDADASLLERIGIVAPLSRPEIGEISAGGAAERAGLRPGDLVLTAGGTTVSDGRQLRALIRQSVRDGQAVTAVWRIEREGRVLALDVQPDVVEQGGALIGRIGAYVGVPPEMVTVQYGPLDGIWQGVVKTWEVSVLTLRTLGRMVVGEASLKNLSGPLTIADYAGRSASLGLTSYLVFLALISVSLGVLNLLPLPVLDGGHLMYYLWEGVTGRPVSEAWLERLQRAGVVVLALMMSIALFNDVTRLLG